MADGRRLGEAAFVVAAVVAVVLSAAFLPTVSLLSSSSLPDGLPGSQIPQMSGGGSGNTAGGQGTGQFPDIGAPGGLAGGSLSQPPAETQLSGGLSGANRVPLFTVESPVNTYWRQTAYSQYTGTGWEQSVERQPLSSGVPNDDLTRDDDRFSYRVTMLQGGRSLPTAWQPESIRFTGDAAEPSVTASTVGGIQSERSLPEGTSYVAESAAPPRDPAVLRQASGRTPRDIREKYTELPLGTDDRIAERTSEIVAGADSQYERAQAVQQWLKTNRGYSLNTSIDPSEPIAEQLLFEVDAAYCQHFATTMAVMLRTQDIPSRYVVGFAPGEPVGDDEYLVTSDRAHAWVEVYIDGVGWVRFDPTPAGELPVSTPEPPYELSLNRSAVVGAPVAVSVTKNNSAVSGLPVYVNDERVGWSGADGTVATTLPYAEEVTIKAGDQPAGTKYDDMAAGANGDREAVRSVTATSAADDGGTSLSAQAAADSRSVSRSVPAGASMLPLSVAGVGSAVLSTLTPEPARIDSSGSTGSGAGGAVPQADGDSTATYPLETNATVEVLGEPTAGETATVVTTVGNVPVTEATVALDGTRVGTTTGEGTYEFSLADVAAGSHRVTVTREPVRATTRFTVAEPGDEDDGDDESRLEPNVSVAPATGIALPGVPATANVSRFGEPVGGVAVHVDGETVGTTNANGTVAFGLPVAPSTTVAATVTGVRGETQLAGLYRNAAGVAVALAIVVGGLVALARRYGITRGTIRAAIGTVVGRLRQLPGRLTAAMIRLAARFEAAASTLADRLRAWPTLLSTSLSELLQRLDPRRPLAALVAWLRRNYSSCADAEPHQRAKVT
ncbi:hypothetical protein HKK80_02400 [Halonotius sp. F2-221B]|uniref:transglutaminase family protein n=1 Tax=Halonotius sp. F2-221B TaxID=2731620 RepID=UPI00398AE2A1